MFFRVFRLILIILFFSSSGCNITAASSIGNYKKPKETIENKKIEARFLENLYLNSDQETIRSALGKPKYIQKEASPYLVDGECHGTKCEVKVADEAWIYEFKDKDDRGWYFYTLLIYFVGGKVVRIT